MWIKKICYNSNPNIKKSAAINYLLYKKIVFRRRTIYEAEYL